MTEYVCQYFGHPLTRRARATARVRFYCTRCTRGSTPETQTDLDMCDHCRHILEARTDVWCPECRYLGDGVEFVHPDGPPTGRPLVHRGVER